MQTIKFKYIKSILIITFLCFTVAGIILTSCQKDEETNDKVALYSFGPMPIARGAELKFIGNKLDKVTSIILPDNIEITSFTSQTSSLITLTVPQNAVEGLVIIKSPDGEITTKTPIGYSEPISIASMLPLSVKAGAELTITGDYLNLVKEVIFTDRVGVPDSVFVSQSRTEIKLVVPAEAQTGKLAVSNGAEDPVIVYSEGSLTLILPAITSVTPDPVKAGTALTIAGTNLDLVKSVKLGGGKTVTSFTSHSATEIVLTVPADTKDGKVVLVPASEVEVSTASDLVMVVPVVSVSPTSVKNGADITVTGTDLDLVSKVVFGGDKEGVIKAGGTSTQIMVTIPDNAMTGIVKFVTLAAKEVSGPSLTLIDPVFTSFTPGSAKANQDIVITGTNLDLVVNVLFEGAVLGTIKASSETEITVTVPVGAKEGKVILKTKNGSSIISASNLTVLTNLPVITSFSEAKGTPGEILTINGTSLLLIKELEFPGGITATAYGAKSDTQIEVYVPADVKIGKGKIIMKTYEGEEGLLPEIFFGGTDPIKDPNLIINDFDESGHDLGWDNWNGNVELGNDPAKGISGKYMHGVNAACAGWTWIWGCNHDQLVKRSVTTADHLLKMDINITTPLSGDYNFQMKLGGSDIDLGKLGISDGSGNYSTTGWITITFDLSTFGSLPATIPGAGDWGMMLNYGTIDITGLYIDNIRFEAK